MESIPIGISRNVRPVAVKYYGIAIAFIGPFRDPVRSVWVIEFGMIACVLVIPFALGMGSIRGIPLGWRLIDCSFGVFGILPLWYCRRLIVRQMSRPGVAESGNQIGTV